MLQGGVVTLALSADDRLFLQQLVRSGTTGGQMLGRAVGQTSTAEINRSFLGIKYRQVSGRELGRGLGRSS